LSGPEVCRAKASQSVLIRKSVAKGPPFRAAEEDESGSAVKFDKRPPELSVGNKVKSQLKG
jgi:hypothetical protein